MFKAWINNTISTGAAYAGSGFGLVQLNGNLPGITVSADAMYDSNKGNWSPKFNISVEDDNRTPPALVWERQVDIARDTGINSAWAGLRYTSSIDRLEIGIFDNENLSGGPIVGMDYTAFNAAVNPGPMHVFMSGSSDYGLPIINGQSTFDNFQGSVAPEPISSALFLLGGGVLAVRRFRKKS